jgi:ComF family protein
MLCKVINEIIDLVLPRRCLVTGTIVHGAMGLSTEGFKKMDFITEPYCIKCAAPLSFSKEVCFRCVDQTFAFHQARSVFVYTETSKKLIMSYKHGDRLQYTPIFSKWLSDYGKSVLEDADYIVPVPLHPSRMRKRLYNQAAELVKGVERITQIPYFLDGLIRVDNCPSQGHNSRTQRYENVRQSFVVNKNFIPLVPNKNIVIIDDVLTTGATLNSNAAVLALYNPQKISVLTLAKVV